MKEKGRLFTAAAAGLLCVGVVWMCSVIYGRERTYAIRPEVRPEITLPEYRSDTTRMIDSYERMMDRYAVLAERDFGAVGADIRLVLRRLDFVDRKLGDLGFRLGRIEKALGIEEPNKPSGTVDAARKTRGNVAPEALRRVGGGGVGAETAER